jgi:hypothetical protein
MVDVLLLGVAVWVGAVGLVMATRPMEVARFRALVGSAGAGSTSDATPAKVTLVRRAGTGLAVLAVGLGAFAVL